jgi:Domain of unknown function (DUF4375)
MALDKNRYLIELSEGERTQFGRLDFDEQTEPQKVFSAIWELESQINNGGFDQFFRNSETAVIMFAPVALMKIGAASCSRIVERAIALVAPLPPTPEGRASAVNASLEGGQEVFDELDSEFFAYPDNLTELLFDYVCKHPESFGSVPR